MNQVKIGEFLRELRKGKGLTQEQLAEMLGVSSQTISKWENEVTMPDIMLLTVIAGCFDITVDELYYGKKPMKKRQAVDYVIKNQKRLLEEYNSKTNGIRVFCFEI